MSDRPPGVTSWYRSIWILLWAFLGFGAATTLIAVIVGPGDDPNTKVGWMVLGIVTFTQLAALAVMRPRWFTRPPTHIPGAVLTGVFLRIAFGELVFLTGFILFFAEAGNAAILLAGFAISIALIWWFAAPTGHNVLMLQDQLDRVGGQGDVATELAAARPARERPPR